MNIVNSQQQMREPHFKPIFLCDAMLRLYSAFPQLVSVRDLIQRNKVPCEFLVDAKPPIQMSQGHPKYQKNMLAVWNMWVCMCVWWWWWWEWEADFSVGALKDIHRIFLQDIVTRLCKLCHILLLNIFRTKHRWSCDFFQKTRSHL